MASSPWSMKAASAFPTTGGPVIRPAVFFVGLRDEQKIWGTRCASCRYVHIPPRNPARNAFIASPTGWKCPARGVVTTFTIARRQLASLKQCVPVIFGLILLDGAETSLLHCIGDIFSGSRSHRDAGQGKILGNPQGRIRDITCFVPCE